MPRWRPGRRSPGARRQALRPRFHAEATALVHVVGVDEQGGAGAEGTQLRLERFTFTVVQQGERVGAGADSVQAVAQASLQVGGAREAGDTTAARAAETAARS